MPSIEIVYPPSDWSIGLDRGENVALIRREPEHAEIKITEEMKLVATAPPMQPIMEVPSVLEIEIAKPTSRHVEIKEPTPPPALTIDSPGAIIRIDRQPDHAVIPIVGPTYGSGVAAPIVSVEKTAVVVETTPTKTKKVAKQPKPAKPKKTSALDMPLINILTPKTTPQPPKEKKPAKAVVAVDKKKKKTKSTKLDEVNESFFV